MSCILRVYDPEECDAAGVPLDWHQCRPCRGAGEVAESLTPRLDPRDPAHETSDEMACPRCEGHGSLHAAALAHFRREAVYLQPDPPVAGREVERRAREVVLRCSGCRHPMGREPTAELQEFIAGRVDWARVWLSSGREPTGPFAPWSDCDGECCHGGPVRYDGSGYGWGPPEMLDPEELAEIVKSYGVQAVWRTVGVRPLGWPHDLRPDKLDVLCLRCWANPKEATTDAR